MGSADVEAEIQSLGTRLLDDLGDGRRSILGRERWEELLLRRLMESEEFKTQALRFVDVLPALGDDAELVRHLNEYFVEEELPLPGVARWGIKQAGRGGLAQHAAAATVRRAITALAHRFIGGSTAAEAVRTARRLWDDGMAFTLDVLGEATVSEAEAEGYRCAYLDLLAEMSPAVARWPERPQLDRRSLPGGSERQVPRLNLSVKISALYSQMDPVDLAGSVREVSARLRPILRRAREQGAAITFDMEQYQYKEITLRAFRDLAMEPEFRDWPDIGIALQAYLREAEADTAALVAWARERGAPISVRLVRGAYWDYENIISRQHGWAIPVFTAKRDTDLCYENCAQRLLQAYPSVETAIATHNVRSIAAAIVHARSLGMSPDQYEIQMLFGMADPLKDAVVRAGERLRVYLPFGQLIPGMAYLVRRLLENSASQSFLRLGFAENVPAAELLLHPGRAAPSGNGATPGADLAADDESFGNEPVRRFTDPAERQRFAAALERVRGSLGREYPLVIGGRALTTGRTLVSVNPARPDEIVGTCASGSPAEADAAVAAALAAFPAWRDLGAHGRAALLLRAAGIMRERRDDLAAWQVFEVGKHWREADADVTEAIDFIRYYAAEAVRLSAGRPLLSPPGERNEYTYAPRGVAAVIPPWNFPLAILTGMATAALAVGNTVVLKPASQSPVIAAQLAAILAEAGLPAGVCNLLTGPGGEMGEALVAHPDVQIIAFTGSREVGCRILRRSAELAGQQPHIKRVIAELGGKNALIIDNDADLDDAVVATVASAFGYQGQKCSACSRVLVMDGVHDAFLRRLVEATRSLRMGPPDDPGNLVGPVVDARSRDRIRETIESARRDARVEVERDVTDLGDGYWIGPTVFSGVDPASSLAQEEIFGPVLAVIRVANLDEALRVANGTSYALTGGIFSRSPANLARTAGEFRVGNLYLNRKITGAAVARQPFGGFKLSGVGTKAGGPDYLLQFVEPRVVTENTLRRGFAPD